VRYNKEIQEIILVI